MDPNLLYGLDIETDTSTDGLDPRVSAIVAVALATSRGTLVVTGDEAQLLRDLDSALADLAPGVIVTWNGGAFDLPFLDDRARQHGVPLSLRVVADPLLHVHSEPLPGHEAAYRASWGGHGHLDAYRVYRADVGVGLGLSCGLKAMARLVGLTPVEVDRAAISDLSPAELERYVASDAELARTLVLRRWSSCASAVDAVPRTSGVLWAS